MLKENEQEIKYVEYIKSVREKIKDVNCGTMQQEFKIDERISVWVYVIDHQRLKLYVYFDGDDIGYEYIYLVNMPKTEAGFFELCRKMLRTYVVDRMSVVDVYLHLKETREWKRIIY